MLGTGVRLVVTLMPATHTTGSGKSKRADWELDACGSETTPFAACLLVVEARDELL